MTCKDCIHNGICIWTQVNSKNHKVCKDFKNKADFEEVKDLSPCDVCAYNPPSSFDGKPCALCPAKKKGVS